MTTRTIFAIALLLALPFGSKAGYSLDKVSFFDTPLVCNAARDIGCGSRSKPVLLEMEQHSSIKEAWLNRPGTVIAVVWNDDVSAKDRSAIIEPMFTQHKVGFVLVKKKAIRSEHIASLGNEGEWYRGSEVDQLSIEEAGRIADEATSRVLDAGLIDEKEAEAIGADIEAYFAKELVKIRSLDQLRADEEMFYDEIGAIFERHIGKERSERIWTWAEEAAPAKQDCKTDSEACGTSKRKKRKADKSCCNTQ